MIRQNTSAATPSGSRAFATLYALTLLGLLATAITLIASQLAYETRRTSDQLVDAQLRSLLRAAVDAGVDSPSPVLPSELVAAGFSVTVTSDPTDRAVVHITARRGPRSLSDTLGPAGPTLTRP